MGDRASGEYQLFNLRLPVETLSRLHRYRDYLNQTPPGIDANVSMAARMLLFRALDQVEEEMGIRKKAKAGASRPGPREEVTRPPSRPFRQNASRSATVTVGPISRVLPTRRFLPALDRA